jgi:hypothetical protein
MVSQAPQVTFFIQTEPQGSGHSIPFHTHPTQGSTPTPTRGLLYPYQGTVLPHQRGCLHPWQETARGQPYNCQGAVLKLPGDCLTTRCQGLPYNCQGTALQLPEDCLIPARVLPYPSQRTPLHLSGTALSLSPKGRPPLRFLALQ